MGVIALAAALPACVLSEQWSALDDGEGSTGAVNADAEGPSPSSTTAGGSLPADDDTGGAPGDPARMSASSDDDGTAGDDDVEPDTSTGEGPMVFSEDCCSASDTIGCADPQVQACVCALDSYCCETAWDEVCVDLMIDAGCLACGSGTQLVPESCCMATGMPGCPDDPVRECVCELDAYCCNVLWDDECVELVDELECGTCKPPACCATSSEPGCSDDAQIEACVCAGDGYCCDEQWDNLCVSEITMFGCGTCGPLPEGGGCCVANDTPGCGDPDIEACVCPGDPFCCTTAWDSLCVDEVGTYGCADCSTPTDPPMGDTGDTGDTGDWDAGGSGESGSDGAITYGQSG